eukprot:5556563-Prymnesium_polylepis.1
MLLVDDILCIETRGNASGEQTKPRRPAALLGAARRAHLLPNRDDYVCRIARLVNVFEPAWLEWHRLVSIGLVRAPRALGICRTQSSLAPSVPHRSLDRPHALGRIRLRRTDEVALVLGTHGHELLARCLAASYHDDLAAQQACRTSEQRHRHRRQTRHHCRGRLRRAAIGRSEFQSYFECSRG